MAISFASSACVPRLKRAPLLVVGFGRCASMEKQCTRSRCRIITEQLVSCAAALPMISSRSPANRMSPSWKPRRSPAISCRGVCRADAAFAEFLNKYAPQTGPAILHPEEPPVGGRTKRRWPRDRRPRMRIMNEEPRKTGTDWHAYFARPTGYSSALFSCVPAFLILFFA